MTSGIKLSLSLREGTKVNTKIVESVSERSHKRSQTNLCSCFSKVKEESVRKTNNMEADTNLFLTFYLSQEEVYSQVLEFGDSEITFVV